MKKSDSTHSARVRDFRKIHNNALRTSNGTKFLTSLSLDLDNLWSYLQINGDPHWETFPSYIDTFIPMILDVLDKLDLKTTFFIVGQDAALEKNRNFLKLITEKGHEIGNHSFSHEPWVHLYSKDKVRAEIIEAEDNIIRVTGQKPIGYRSPGFARSMDLLEVLNENGYLYDASSLPTYLGPLARAYYFSKSNLSVKEKEKRKKLAGEFKDGLLPVKPRLLTLDSGAKLLEIPVTTIPVCRTPFHLSYLIYLCLYSKVLMSFYLKLALSMCRITKAAPRFLLHPVDFLDSDQVPELSFFPGMNINRTKKLEIFHNVTHTIQRFFTLATMGTYAKSITLQN